MKLLKKTAVYLLIISFLIAHAFQASASTEERKLTILFTHDLHDHFLSGKTEINGKTAQTGGYARIKTVIDMQREEKENCILVDGGDYSMGTLFQAIFTDYAPELRVLGQMGYDATTFGNHEFDFKDSGLSKHLNAAKNSGNILPRIVTSNIGFPESNKMTDSLKDLKQAMSDYGVKEYAILERGGIKIGVFGLTGKDAADCAPVTEVVFNDIFKSAKDTAEKLKNKEKVDLIVCLSHSGTSKELSDSEDEQLARRVPEIDVIISGHTHTTLNKPIISGRTIIGSCGEYGNYLGIMDIIQEPDGRWKLQAYQLKPIDGSIEENSEIAKTAEIFKSIVQQKYLNKYGMKFDEVLAKASFSFIPASEIGREHKEEPLGNLLADGYIHSVRQAEGDNYEPVTVAIVTAGVMRGSFVKGDITVADAFAASSLGIGADGAPGYPLISLYLTGRELRDLCEVDASISTIMSSAQLYMSGLSFTFNPNRLILNRVTGMYLQGPDGALEKAENSKLYRVVTGLYNAQMLSVVAEKSFGLLSIVPKTKEGTPITDFEGQIIHNIADGYGNEVKEWLSLAQYLKSFYKVDGTPGIPEYYNKTHDRKIVDDNKKTSAILAKPNSFAVKVYIGCAAVLLFAAFVIYLLAVRRKAGKRTGLDTCENRD
ncbi:2',3'-cyclic-nucleotide 2'-phosphodiesterase (5'-nucleotidase family) [Ruminiclostridium sufflavum DSM 19573]|uniref:2',3'-cyclic-nucleotide 2'-phosphodiesterase (5'-nucleotidase family) n=1 Tax=Ruminiclostridium sufflavum DSM 19573 TaxID=1121337 RepID=A0A318Y6W1_9FIRM|nr:bifunctional UDP-sugar hydrolase/5'-nucleotidase [Ruminiclostridium sufflavum]PYG87817.1 2',3'-cyclic-nucleotide 2'-phosphodiesterase (5'-nucleotidase family) [Ruminiclostridium sufflavum DSM 19573]